MDRSIVTINKTSSIQRFSLRRASLSSICYVTPLRARRGAARCRLSRPGPGSLDSTPRPRAGISKSMRSAEHRPSVRGRTDVSATARRANTNALRLLELRAKLPTKLVTVLLDFKACAAPVPAAAVTQTSSKLPPMRLQYNKPTPLCKHHPLPYGHMLVENYIDPDTHINVGTAAVIPSEWQLQIAPYQFMLRDASGRKINVPRTYEVNDVTRESKVADLLADVRAFLKVALRRQVRTDAVDALPLQLARREGAAIVPLLSDACASDRRVNLFNLGAADFEKGGEQLVIVTPDVLPDPPSPYYVWYHLICRCAHQPTIQVHAFESSPHTSCCWVCCISR
eukprot:2216038-Prymnesium_polylepis.2